MKYIVTDKAPAAVGPYSQAVKLDNGFLYVSGQLGFNPQTMQLSGNIKEEAAQSLKNVEEILKAANYNINNIVKVTIMLKNIADFGEVNKIYETFLKDHKPSRSTLAAKELPRDALIEIDVIAFKQE